MRKKLPPVILIIASLLIVSCERGTKTSKFVHEDPGFSFEYPADYKAEPPLTPIEVARFVKQNEFKVPVFTAVVRSRSEGTKLEDLPERIVKSMAETIPNSSQYDIFENKSVKLKDGSAAVLFKFRWLLPDGKTVMETAIIGAFKGD